MTQYIYTLEDLPLNAEYALLLEESAPKKPFVGARLDAELRRVVARLAREVGVELMEESERSARQNLLRIANRYHGPERQKLASYCEALHLMAQYQFREALLPLEQVMLGAVDPAFEGVREMALRSHSVCLEQLDFDELSMERFLGFLYQKFDEMRSSGEADGVARSLGLGWRRGAEGY